MILPAIFRPHRCDVWRETESLNADGTRAPVAWERIATNALCRFQTGESVKAPDGFIKTESDNMFSYDLVHFDGSADVGEGDILRQTTGPDVGEYWTVRGDSQKRAQFADKLSIRASRTAAVKSEISEAYS